MNLSDRRWLTRAALNQITEGPQADAAAGALALAAFLKGTRAEDAAADYADFTQRANAQAKKILPLLDDEASLFDPT